MSEWPRYPIPAVPGWNNPDSGPSFTVQWVDDQLVMSGPAGIFAGLDSISGSGTFDGNPWTFTINSGDFTLDGTNSVATLANAWAFLVGSPGSSATIEQLDFFTADPTLIGIWTGSVAAVEPSPGGIEDLLVSYNYGDDVLTIESPYGSFDGSVDQVRLWSSMGGEAEVPPAYFTVVSPSTIELSGMRTDSWIDGYIVLVEVLKGSELVGRSQQRHDASDPSRWLGIEVMEYGDDTVRLVGDRLDLASVTTFFVLTTLGSVSVAESDPGVTRDVDYIDITNAGLDGRTIEGITLQGPFGNRSTLNAQTPHLPPIAPLPVVP